jgi:ADP-heptose:LPS heptosyltransferase
MVWKAEDPMGNEARKIVWEVAPYLRGRGLDLGAGDFRILPHATTVDNLNHSIVFGHPMRPDIRCNVEKLDMIASQSQDWVFSSHTLEHLKDTEAVLREWWRVVKPNGLLVLYLPHKLFYPNIGQPGGNPTHLHDFMPDDVIAKMPNGWDLIEKQDRNEDREYSFLLVFKKMPFGKANYHTWEAAKPEKTALVIRYGAFGDNIQASSVLAGLKEQGFHITLFASPPGSDVLKHDPHIDKMVLFDKDQVPNGDLGPFWAWHAKKYDRFVNLSESVEGAFLAIPGRSLFLAAPGARHMVANHNYLEYQHALAKVPHKPQVKFYATAEEKAWARKIRKDLGDGPVVLWSLAGSAVHKTWAGLDPIIATFMLHTDVKVVLVGGPDGVLLEAAWEKEPRVMRTCGKWSIRQSLAFALECDLIIGPETGVLNAMCCEPMPKICFLSHSTHENLTRDWVNTTPLWSKSTICKGRGDNEAPACHQLHYNWDACTKAMAADGEPMGVAQCQADIGGEEVWDAIVSVMVKKPELEAA